jgi:hypothetical protein
MEGETMSSTNRSNRGGMDADYFVTPVDTIADFLAAFAQDDHEARFALSCNANAWHKMKKNVLAVFDPAAGGDACNAASYPAAINLQASRPTLHPKAFWPCVIKTMDIRQDSQAMLKGDYLLHKFPPKGRPDVIITNPPFALAQHFIAKALEDVQPHGLVVMLLRLNFFGSEKRREFWEANMPFVTYIHAKRPSFWPEHVSPAMQEWCRANDVEQKRHGATDSIEYMHCVWQAGWKPRHTLARVI